MELIKWFCMRLILVALVMGLECLLASFLELSFAPAEWSWGTRLVLVMVWFGQLVFIWWALMQERSVREVEFIPANAHGVA